jgi:hypothetical protein
MLIDFTWCLTGSKLISITPFWTIRRPVASAHLDSIYLTSGKAIDEEERLRALTAYMADLVVDTGELDLTVGRVPGREQEAPKPAAESESDVVDMALMSGNGGSDSGGQASAAK